MFYDYLGQEYHVFVCLNSNIYNAQLSHRTYELFLMSLKEINLERKDVIFLKNVIEIDRDLTQRLSVQRAPYLAYFPPESLTPEMLYHQHDPELLT